MQQRIFDTLGEADIPVTEANAARLAKYLALLERWNEVFNLTGITDRDEMLRRHLVESLALERFLKGRRIADVGSGAGLPGIPLAIACPERHFTLIESRAKRARFLRHVSGELELANVEVVESRAENMTPEPAFDTVLARAVASPPELLDLTKHFIAPGGILLLPTKADFEIEKSAFDGDVVVRRVRDSRVDRLLRGCLVMIETAMS